MLKVWEDWQDGRSGSAYIASRDAVNEIGSEPSRTRRYVCAQRCPPWPPLPCPPWLPPLKPPPCDRGTEPWKPERPGWLKCRLGVPRPMLPNDGALCCPPERSPHERFGLLCGRCRSERFPPGVLNRPRKLLCPSGLIPKLPRGPE